MAVSTGGDAQRYKFSGKELIRDHGIDWYDHGARWYDATAPTWHTMDPLCEKKPGVTPYMYCASNPVRYNDPNGMDEWEINEQGKIVSQTKTKEHDAFFTIAGSVLMIIFSSINLADREYVGFHPSFSRHAIADASIALDIWLNENVGFHPSFSRHAIADASIALVIWLNENVDTVASAYILCFISYI